MFCITGDIALFVASLFTLSAFDRYLQAIQSFAIVCSVSIDGPHPDVLSAEWSEDGYVLKVYKARNSPNVQLGQVVEEFCLYSISNRNPCRKVLHHAKLDKDCNQYEFVYDKADNT